MATEQFNGFELVDGTKEDFSIDNLNDKKKIYFVRTDDSGEEGYIYFNKKKYGAMPDTFDCGEY